MALEDINIGTNPDDGTGDKLRNAFIKINTAIDEIENKMPLLDKDNPLFDMEVSAIGSAAMMRVIDKETGHLVATMEWLKAEQEFVFNLLDKNTGLSKATFEIKPDGKAYIGGIEMLTVETIDPIIREYRHTVTKNIVNHAKPSLAECKQTFKQLPHYDWLKDDDYYIKDTTGGKIVLIKYRTKAGATEANSGNFFYEVLTKVT